ncbi:MAG: hypothetical protein H6709_25015 [Kofleriaceae bacterium]|nr:hypothetical protein [Myxococcales bacterium]MCB9561086.1 hypothetical protein [Kofleriaceae bacterium]MCB9573442.1 hypothetical protein [Kofleriaceae bacterium]MCB9575351.1 hypothetical protein [Kofleriaceae bacterium]
MKLTTMILGGASAVLVAACGGGDDVPAVDVEACQHLQGGPFQALTAGAVRDSSAPGIDDDHVAYQVTLPARGGGQGGFVFFGAAVAGDYVLFLDGDVDVEVTDSAGATVAPSATATSSAACGEVRRRLTVPMELGTYFLDLSSAATEVTAVIEPATPPGGE